MIRSKWKELWTRLVRRESRTGIYLNGYNDTYPDDVENLIDSSISATMAARTMAAFLRGRGFYDEEQDFTVNFQKNLTINDCLELASYSVARHRGFYLHVNYNAMLEVNYLDVLPYKQIRKSKEDDKGFGGKYFYYDVDYKSLTSKKQTKPNREIWRFNPKLEVIRQQIEEDAKRDGKDTGASWEDKVRQYRGQVIFVNLDPFAQYPQATIHTVMLDCDSEYRSSLVSNNQLRNGFIEKTVAHIVRTGDEELDEGIDNDIINLMGADNAGGVLLMDTERGEDGKPLEDVVFSTIPTEIDDKLFEYTDKKVFRKIISAFNNQPEALARSSEGALFSPSDDSLRLLMSFYHKQTEMERAKISKAFSQALGFIVNVIPLVEEEDMMKAQLEKAQVKLRASKDGMLKVAEIVAEVRANIELRESSANFLRVVFGYEEEEIEAILPTEQIDIDNGE